MSFKKINYGIVGAGHIGNFHSQQIQNIKPSIHVVGIYDINFKQAQQIASQNNIVAFKNLKKLLSLCDAVSVATPADTHTEIALQALEQKCHVFIEKPLATTIADCKKIIASSEKNNVLVQVGHIERFNPAFVMFNKHNQDLPKFIESKRLTPFTERGIDTNVILDLMIHDIDLILHLVKSEIKSIEANGISILTNSLDLVNARLSFKNGCVANLTASRISDSPMRKLRFFSNHKYASLDFQQHQLMTYRVEKKRAKPSSKSIFSFDNKSILLDKQIIPNNNALFEELLSFIMSIHKSQDIQVSAWDGLRAIEVAIMIQNKINEQT
jgi:predicted dehydrogenase